MNELDLAAWELGDEPPLNGAGRSGPPDRREISARWLSGTFLTGITSSILMGVALFAALDAGNVVTRASQAATPPPLDSAASATGEATKTGRLVASRILASMSDRRRMEISTLQRENDVDIVRTVPFVHVDMALAAGHSTDRDYPAFDPLEVFAEEAPPAPTVAMGQIYGAKVESEVSLRTTAFPLDSATFDTRSELSADEVEAVVRNTGAILTDGDIQVAALHYVDPQRFGDGLAGTALGNYGIRVVPENVSIAPREPATDVAPEFAEDMVVARREEPIAELLAEAGYDDPPSVAMAEAVAKMADSETLPAGSVLRIGLEIAGEEARIMRASLYQEAAHRATVAIDDRGQFVPGDEPEPNPAIAIAMQGSIPVIGAAGNLPTVYDGIYRAAYSYGLNRDMTRQLIRLLAAEVDYQSRLGPTDRIELFFSNPDADDSATGDSELLYVSASFGATTRSFYRFQMEDGTLDYFDEEGRSARQFLLRNPVPNGRFTSGFGGRRHPILGYVRAHTGVDWAAPRGTPIIASGNGVVEEAGWTGGYGRQTIIRHANGYVSSYSHQHAIADGVRAGARVRQGQVIGYVGSTGLSTGNHLHYELIVNGTKVDPMRVRLPQNRSLEGQELEAFNYERQRIDALLNGDPVPPLRMAATN
ncbi:M23 family metallopeptidase [Aliihoeflea sp. 40Bstr573]|uniref:M23 family metallopeptidase n=1 Tax=Aliihoeflea sp. 40Bstr573 TaxID=2696467 RepID=UPI0020947539|nr:M23 family metallopeptidase [Aliihoeflea sp. 40Bstr573]MCO6387215.1 peptidoglycan DD-metalloendopeptidase family protein [Aliihoeflea sp. 40Bstr573]